MEPGYWEELRALRAKRIAGLKMCQLWSGGVSRSADLQNPGPTSSPVELYHSHDSLTKSISGLGKCKHSDLNPILVDVPRNYTGGTTAPKEKRRSRSVNSHARTELLTIATPESRSAIGRTGVGTHVSWDSVSGSRLPLYSLGLPPILR